jgi:hypothetical protein
LNRADIVVVAPKTGKIKNVFEDSTRITPILDLTERGPHNPYFQTSSAQGSALIVEELEARTWLPTKRKTTMSVIEEKKRSGVLSERLVTNLSISSGNLLSANCAFCYFTGSNFVGSKRFQIRGSTRKGSQGKGISTKDLAATRRSDGRGH